MGMEGGTAGKVFRQEVGVTLLQKKVPNTLLKRDFAAIFSHDYGT